QSAFLFLEGVLVGLLGARETGLENARSLALHGRQDLANVGTGLLLDAVDRLGDALPLRRILHCGADLLADALAHMQEPLAVHAAEPLGELSVDGVRCRA